MGSRNISRLLLNVWASPFISCLLIPVGCPCLDCHPALRGSKANQRWLLEIADLYYPALQGSKANQRRLLEISDFYYPALQGSKANQKRLLEITYYLAL